MPTKVAFLIASALMTVPAPAKATTLVFSSATATFQQTQGGFWPASEMIDGVTTGSNGWAIYQFSGSGDQTLSETALLTLATPLANKPTNLTFTIYQNYGNEHLLGDFSLGYTTSVSPTLTSAQTPFNLTSSASLNGTTFTSTSPGQLLAGGPLPQTDTYTITTTVDAPITGIFLNAINDPTNGLANGGPGRQPNGNFVISEFVASTTSATPEPSSWAMLVVGLGTIGLALRKRRAFPNQCGGNP